MRTQVVAQPVSQSKVLAIAVGNESIVTYPVELPYQNGPWDEPQKNGQVQQAGGEKWGGDGGMWLGHISHEVKTPV